MIRYVVTAHAYDESDLDSIRRAEGFANGKRSEATKAGALAFACAQLISDPTEANRRAVVEAMSAMADEIGITTTATKLTDDAVRLFEIDETEP